MTYFALLPIGIIVVLAVDFTTQRAFRHFVDVHASQRAVIAFVAAWFALGWLLEAESASGVYAVADECQERLEVRLEALRRDFNEMVGVSRGDDGGESVPVLD